MTQLPSALLHWLWLSPHLSTPLTMTVFPCFNARVIFCHEPISHSLIYSFLCPCVLSLVSSLGIGNPAAVHALGRVVFQICVLLKYHRSGEAPSYFLSNFFIKACGQWFLYWPLPLICPHHYKRIPLTNANLPFLVWSVFHGGLFQCSELMSRGSLDFVSLIRNPMEYYSWAFWKHFNCIYLLMFSSWECSSFVCVCVFI